MSTRRFAGLLAERNTECTNQGGEDGVLERLLQVLGPGPYKYCVEVGAWDGEHLSNTSTPSGPL